MSRLAFSDCSDAGKISTYACSMHLEYSSTYISLLCRVAQFPRYPSCALRSILFTKRRSLKTDDSSVSVAIRVTGYRLLHSSASHYDLLMGRVGRSLLSEPAERPCVFRSHATPAAAGVSAPGDFVAASGRRLWSPPLVIYSPWRRRPSLMNCSRLRSNA